MSDNDRIIVRTISRDTWVTVGWSAATDDHAIDMADIDIDIHGNMYLRFRNDNDDPFILLLDDKGLRIYETEDLPPNQNDAVAFDAERYHQFDSPYAVVLRQCEAETWANAENSDAHTPADIAADIIRRLAHVYPEAAM